MLALARRRAAQVQFVEADALHLPFADNSFEIVSIGYGLRNLASWEAGLAEMWRVAAPGGRLLVLDFGKPENPLMRSLYYTYLRSCVPLFGRVFCRDADTHAYILASLRDYPAQRGVAAKLESLGGRDVKTKNFLAGAMSLSFARKPA
jgi:demethylmenaquinone methyltransferase/2-methoxy-6-polyprenyl-1,4-benzoquinol methylase